MPRGQGAEELRPDWLDVVALTIAAFQIVLPVLGLLFGAALLVYLLLLWWAR